MQLSEDYVDAQTGRPLIFSPITHDELMALTKVAVANSIAVAAALRHDFSSQSQSQSQQQRTEVTFSFDTHPEFPVLGLKKRN